MAVINVQGKSSKGKCFEDDIKQSIPDYCMTHRLRDSAQSFTTHSQTKFSWDNECDFFIFDDKHILLYTIECKSTKFRSMSYETKEEYEYNKANKIKSKRMIKYHQIQSLTNFSKFENIVSGLFLNFRDDERNLQRTYFLNIKDYNLMIKTLNKKSIDEIDISRHNAVKINGFIKRTRYTWDLNEFLLKYSLSYCKQ